MAVKTKPRYRGITIEVKPNPIFKSPEEFEGFQNEKPWWQRIINRLLLFKR
jgi:hypothetical protein